MSRALDTSSATAPWLATSGSNRAIPVHQTGPVNQLGRGHRAEGGVPEPSGSHRPSRFEREAAARQLHLPERRAEQSKPPHDRRALVSSEARFPDRFTLLRTLGGSRTLTPFGTRS